MDAKSDYLLIVGYIYYRFEMSCISENSLVDCKLKQVRTIRD